MYAEIVMLKTVVMSCARVIVNMSTLRTGLYCPRKIMYEQQVYQQMLNMRLALLQLACFAVYEQESESSVWSQWVQLPMR